MLSESTRTQHHMEDGRNAAASEAITNRHSKPQKKINEKSEYQTHQIILHRMPRKEEGSDRLRSSARNTLARYGNQCCFSPPFSPFAFTRASSFANTARGDSYQCARGRVGLDAAVVADAVVRSASVVASVVPVAAGFLRHTYTHTLNGTERE